jgi:uncharacterized membrane protein YsdA (DUF1294 family)/cold shock CspA family protein
MAAMRIKGKMTSWNDERGFGFVTPLTGGREVFIHIKAFSNRSRRPVLDDIVTFGLATDQLGRAHAVQAKLAGDRARASTGPRISLFAILVALSFLIAVGGSTRNGVTPFPLAGIYLAASAISFFTYWIDKWAAKRGSRRIQELTLHLWALAGGWPGALIAQQLFRHKSRKRSFRIAFWITVLVNCGALAIFYMETGRIDVTPFLPEFLPAL